MHGTRFLAHFSLLASLATTAAHVAHAQVRPAQFERWTGHDAAPPSNSGVFTANTYRWEGAAFLASVAVVTFALVAHGGPTAGYCLPDGTASQCPQPSTGAFFIGYGLTAALVGGGIGFLAGSLITKESPSPSPP